MKLTSLCVLLTLLLLIVSPLSVRLLPSDGDEVLLTLDVCHSGAQAVSVNADMPFILEDSFSIVIPEFTHPCLFEDSLSPSIVLSYRLERPPEA